MKKLFVILSISFISFSCKKEKETSSEVHDIDTTTQHHDSISKVISDSAAIENMHLDKFGLLPEIEGCSCHFSENNKDFQNKKFVYVDDYGNNAFIKIEGKLIKIPMEEGDFDPSNFNKDIENESYKINMSGKKIKDVDETMIFEGSMTVENKKTGEKINTPIYGECGC